MSEEKKLKTAFIRFFPPRVGPDGAGAPDFDAPVRVHREGEDHAVYPGREVHDAAGRVHDEWGRDVTDWISIGGKLKPHP